MSEELKNRFNQNFELRRVLDSLTYIDNIDEISMGHNCYRISVKIKNWYFRQHFSEEDLSTYTVVIGKKNGDRYDLTQMDRSDQHLVDRLKQFIRNFYEFFEIKMNEDENVGFCKFFLFILTLIAFDHETDYNYIIDNYEKLSLGMFYDVDLIDMSTVFSASYSPSPKLAIKIEKNLSEPWFTAVCNQTKTIEGRLNKGDWIEIKVGDIIKFSNTELETKREILVKITKINYFESFREYLETEGLEHCLPSIKTIEDGLSSVYDQIFTQNDQSQYIVKSFYLEVV